MTKVSIREFRLATCGEEGLHPYLNERGAFVGDGTPLLTRDDFGDFVPLPQRDLEIVLSAGFGIAVDLGSRMRGLATLAKAMNEGDYAIASIALAHAQFPALPDKGACARMQKVAAMLERGASEAEVLNHFLPKGELAKFKPYHLGPGTGGGQFTTAEMYGASSGVADSQGYSTNLSGEEIVDRARNNAKTPGWLQPNDVPPRNYTQCVSLVRAVIPELPHSSQWQEGDPVTPENAGTIPPGTAIATFTGGHYVKP